MNLEKCIRYIRNIYFILRPYAYQLVYMYLDQKGNCNKLHEDEPYGYTEGIFYQSAVCTCSRVICCRLVSTVPLLFI